MLAVIALILIAIAALALLGFAAHIRPQASCS